MRTSVLAPLEGSVVDEDNDDKEEGDDEGKGTPSPAKNEPDVELL